MKLRDACISGTLALLAGCGGSQPPIGAPGAVPETSTLTTRAERGTSWMLPEAKSENLLYVADYGSGVLIYSYRPARIKLVGYLSAPQLASGECVDNTQNVFVTSSEDEIFEYAHGGTSPIAILTDPVATPINCSIDSTTGSLAVVGYPDLHEPYGAEIYRKGRGKPTFYADGSFGDYECGYDDRGNLFIDGYVYSGRLNFAELPKGSGTFKNITLNQTFRAAGGIQWDGEHVAVGDLYAAVIYQFDIRGSRGTEVGSTPLSGSGTVWQFFIDGDRVIAPSTFQDYAGFIKIYDYPIGGSANRTLDLYSPEGAVVSRSRLSNM